MKYPYKSIREDAAARWAAGRAKHGHTDETGWTGRSPIEEAYEEALDLLNYVERFRELEAHHSGRRRWATTQLVRITVLADALRLWLQTEARAAQAVADADKDEEVDW